MELSNSKEVFDPTDGILYMAHEKQVISLLQFSLDQESQERWLTSIVNLIRVLYNLTTFEE